MAEPPAQHLFDGDRLRASLFAQGGESALYVTFSHRVNEPGAFAPARPVQRALAAGFAHLFIQTRLNDWFINPETAALEAALARLAPGIARRLGIGFSMGGFAALRFAAVLQLDRVTVISPQVSIDPARVPWDLRYRAEAAGFDPVAGDLAGHPAPGLGGAILADPARPLDLAHGRIIAGLFPGLALCRLAFGGHPAAQVLNGVAGVGRLHGLILSGRDSPARVLALHRGARRDSDLYRGRLEAALAARAAARQNRAPALDARPDRG